MYIFVKNQLKVISGPFHNKNLYFLRYNIVCPNEDYRRKITSIDGFTEEKKTASEIIEGKKIFCSKMIFVDDHSKTLPK